MSEMEVKLKLSWQLYILFRKCAIEEPRNYRKVLALIVGREDDRVLVLGRGFLWCHRGTLSGDMARESIKLYLQKC
jgi:hypothetical protein